MNACDSSFFYSLLCLYSDHAMYGPPPSPRLTGRGTAGGAKEAAHTWRGRYLAEFICLPHTTGSPTISFFRLFSSVPPAFRIPAGSYQLPFRLPKSPFFLREPGRSASRYEGRRNRYEKNRIYAMECERRNQV